MQPHKYLHESSNVFPNGNTVPLGGFPTRSDTALLWPPLRRDDYHRPRRKHSRVQSLPILPSPFNVSPRQLRKFDGAEIATGALVLYKPPFDFKVASARKLRSFSSSQVVLSERRVISSPLQKSPGPWVHAPIHKPAPQVPDELTRLIARIERLQAEAITLRVTYEGKQRELRTYIQKIQQCDASFINLQRASVEAEVTPDFTALVLAYNSAVEARNASGPLEDDCERLGIKLAKVELLLVEKSEDYSRLTVLHGIQQMYDTVPSDTDSDSTASVSSESSVVSRLLSPVLGDVGYIEDQSHEQQKIINGDLDHHKSDVLQTAITSPTRQEYNHNIEAEKSTVDHETKIKSAYPIVHWMYDREGRRADFNEVSFTDLQNSLKFIGNNNEVAIRDPNPAPTSITLADLQYFDEGPLLEDQDSTQGRINRWLLHVLSSSIKEKIFFLSMLPNGVYPPSIKSSDFLKLWDAN